MWFQIMKCDENSLTREKDDPDFAPDDEIKTYIEDLEIEVIVINK